MRILFIGYLVFVLPIALIGQDYNILAFGAKADGLTMNTIAVQATIDKAHNSGGGRVIIPPGRFLTGSIVLKSNVELHLQDGAVLLGSTNPTHYIKINRWLALILADNQHDLSITGTGEIDGQGRKLALYIDSLFYAGKLDIADYNFADKRPSHFVRPQLLEFVGCRNINVKHVTLKNAACWVQTYDQCENITIDSVRVDSDAYWNNDGIDIQDCRNVRITNCFVNASDDGICLKSQSSRHSCDQIYIAHCTVRSSASAIKFGTVSHGGFSNVTIENIKIYDTYRSALAIECVDGGLLENIYINNIHATNTGNAIFIRLGDRNPNRTPGILRNVHIKNVTAEISFERPDYKYEIRGPALPFFHNVFPASITGIPGYPVENVVLENIEIQYPGKGNEGLAYMPLSRLKEVPEKESEYPEFSMFGELPAWGFYIRHVNGLQMNDIRLSLSAPDYRPAVVCDDVHDVSMKSLKIIGESKENKVVLNNTTKVLLDSETGVKRMQQ